MNSSSELKAVMFDWGRTILDTAEDRDIPLESRPIHFMPGVKEALPQIKLKMGLWANTQTETEADVANWLIRAGIRSCFSCVVASADFGYKKPDTRFFSNALEKCGYKKEEVLFVGNQLDTDIKGANNYGIRNVWLSDNAYRSEKDTLSPDDIKPTYTINSLTELPYLIEDIQSDRF